jgi:membrane-associated phospholipid phosphatase
MQKMLSIVSKNIILFAGYFIILVASIGFLLLLGKIDSHLLLTSFHSQFLDWFMRIVSWMGDGIFMIIVGLILLFKKLRYGLILLCSFLTSAILAQFFKRVVFPGFRRPVAWFRDQGIEIHRIFGVEHHSAFSFPSGHTTTAFALFFGLAFFVKNKFLKIFFLFMAALTGYSRIFLSQHFLEDVIAGSVLGVLTALLMEFLFEKWKREWMDNDILTLARKKNV